MNNFLRKFQLLEPPKISRKELKIDSDNYKKEIDTESLIKKDLLISVSLEKKNNNKFYSVITITGEIFKNCSKCLDESTINLNNYKIEHYFEYSEYIKENDHDENISFYNTNYIDIFPILRDELLFLMPIYYVCSKECKGLCSVCGNNLNLSSCNH